jgi:16S rRNA (guanine(966)-N(2))-methyltransferase RsmD
VSSTLRVIAGEFGGRSLKTPRGQNTRPTSARVREALFAVLGDIRGARVLDLYAGSGALGIEALSRGAERLVSVESERNAVACIRANLNALGLDSRALVLAQPVRRTLALLVQQAPFDLVLCDPPWSQLGSACEDLARLVSARLLAPEARLVLEHSARDAGPEVEGLVAFDHRRWGDTAAALFRLAENTPPVPGQEAEGPA